MSFLDKLFKRKPSLPKYQSNVRSYLDEYDGKPVYSIVDLGLSEIAPVAEYDRYLAIILPVQINKDGSGNDLSNAELKALHRVEDKCIREAEAKDYLYIGHAIFASAEYMYIAFYCREDQKDEAIRSLQAICTGNGREPTRIFSKKDPEWSYYLEQLYPDIKHIQPINHQEILEDLKKHGDTGTKPRAVSFWLYFPTKAEAERCLGEAASNGYTLETINDMREDKNFSGQKPFALTIRKEMPLTMEQMNTTAWALIDMARKYNGDYDGIETEVLKGG